jgi:predicted short-subunit dehydrogenase-like oxidoreductase (DUF2520 family)
LASEQYKAEHSDAGSRVWNCGVGRCGDSAMLPGMPQGISTKQVMNPRIAIVGAGSLAGALSLALGKAGYPIDEIVSLSRAASLRHARRLAAEVGAAAVTAARARIRAEVVWFCVPDGAIASAAESLKEAADWSGKMALHSSGALTSDELAGLRRRGAVVASVHPLMTFVPGSRPALAGVPFALEGDRKAVQSARLIVLDLRGQPFSIRKRDKQAYHAWGMFTSPLLIALLAASERVAAAAGMRPDAARERMLPILRQTLTNYAALGGAESFSGPIARGDVETVEKHLRVLRAIPEAREIYVALARSALRDLPAKNRAALEKILK